MLRKSIIAVTVLLLAGSCQVPESETFELKLRNSEMILLDATGRSCRLQLNAPTDPDDLKAIKMNLGPFSLKYSGPNPMTFIYIEIKLTGRGIQNGEHSQTFSGTDVGYIWNGAVGNVVVNPSASDQSPASTCSLEIGSIPVTDKRKAIFGQGRMLIYATTTDSKGQGIPVIGETSFTYRFDGVN